jgi:glycosyltransferase involved in cell wall biosynthesis
MGGRLENLGSWINLVGEFSIQLIIIHDVQDESTGPELRALLYEENCNRIELIEGYFGSPGLARNAGIKLAKGDWVAFWDSDDVPQVQQFISMLSSVSDDEVECIIGGYSTVNELNGEMEERILPPKFSDSIALNPGIWRFAFKRESFGSLKFSNLLMAEDQLFLAQYRIFDKKFSIYDRSIYHYYFGGEFHLTQQKKALEDLLYSIEETFNTLGETSDSNFRFVSILLCRQIASCFKHGKQLVRLKIMRVILLGLYRLPKHLYSEVSKAAHFVYKVKQESK